MDIKELNEKYAPLTPEERIRELYSDFKDVLVTTSFGGTSVVLLHLVSKIHPGQVVHFLDTTYHFPETLEYQRLLTKTLGLQVVVLRGEEWRNKYTLDAKVWQDDPDLCCSINKVEPLEKIKHRYQIWISGLMRSQNSHRDALPIFEERGGILKFYPILDQSPEQAEEYIVSHHLPRHPLKAKGFHSIGCVHCTSEGYAREGRWVDKSKTECGLHK